MDITAMDTATIFALKWCEDHRQQLCRKTRGTTSHLSFWTDGRQNRQNGKATCRSKKIICICIVDPALLSKTFQTVIQIKQNQETNHLPLSPPKMSEWPEQTFLPSRYPEGFSIMNHPGGMNQKCNEMSSENPVGMEMLAPLNWKWNHCVGERALFLSINLREMKWVSSKDVPRTFSAARCGTYCMWSGGCQLVFLLD